MKLFAASLVLFSLALPNPAFAQADRTGEQAAISAMLAYRMEETYPPTCAIAALAPPLEFTRRTWNGYHDNAHRRPVHQGWRAARLSPRTVNVAAGPELVARLNRLLAVALDGPNRPAGPPIGRDLLPSGLRLSPDGRDCRSAYLTTPVLVEDLAFIEVGDEGGILYALQRRGDRWRVIALVGIWIS